MVHSYFFVRESCGETPSQALDRAVCEDLSAIKDGIHVTYPLTIVEGRPLLEIPQQYPKEYLTESIKAALKHPLVSSTKAIGYFILDNSYLFFGCIPNCTDNPS